MRGGLAVLAAALLLAGCAPVPQGTTSAPPPASTTPVPAPTTPVRTSEPPATPAPSVAATDSGPSADAERVLSTIPEPLGGATRGSAAAAPRDTTAALTRRATATAPAAAYDTLRASRPDDDQGGAVPVPEPTTPLRPSPVTIDTSAASSPVAAPATPPSSPPTSSPPAASPEASPPTAPPRDPNEPCWRLQVAAPDERAKADSRMAAAQSLLLVPMVIEREKGLWKVRTRDCQSREAADALRRRAIESGFEGAFIVKGAPPR